MPGNNVEWKILCIGNFDQATKYPSAKEAWQLRRADPNAESKIYNTPLARAVVTAPFHKSDYYLNMVGLNSIKHDNLLHFAISRDGSDQLEFPEYLLNEGAVSDVNKLLHQDPPDIVAEKNLIVGCGTPLIFSCT